MKRSVQYASMLATLLAGSLAHAGSNYLPYYSAYANAQEVAGPLKGGGVSSEFLAGVGSIDEKRGVPTVFWAPIGGVWAPGATMARPESAAQFYLEHYAPLYGLAQSALDAAYISQVHDTGRGGIIVIFEQKANGIGLHHTSIKVLMTPAMELVAITGNLHSMAAPTTKRTAPFQLSPQEAIANSFNDYFRTKVPASAFSDLNRPKNGYSYFEMRETEETTAQQIGLARPARIKQVYYPMPDRLVPAYYVELAAGDNTASSVLYAYVIAADDGQMLERVSLTSDAAFTYRVWNEGAPKFTPPDGPQADFAPHPTGTSNNSVPMFVAPSLITVDGLNTNPMGTFDPWLPAGATATNGNNVDAYVDLAAPDGLSGTEFRADVTMAGVFDRTYNTAQAPTSQNQRKAAITQLFVNNNYYHDYWYDSGFNEAAGVAQQSNYGRGGVEGDPIHAEAQDFSGTNNANMQTPADGESPIMQMFVFSPSQISGGPNRDGAIDNGIVGHEWGHYIHGRLNSGGSTQRGGQGEGWGDFQGLMQLVHENDNFAGTFATGVYAAAAFGDSGYYGIRRYPYSTNFAKNGLTFKHIGNGIALPPGGNPAPIFSSQNSEVHNAGEIWCSMLWEGYANFLEDTLGAMPRHTFDQAKRKMADYIVVGMKLAPLDPTYTEQRDGLLAAALAGGNAQDLQDMMDGFATRGAGACAKSPPRDSTDLIGVVEDFSANKANAQFVSFTLTEATPSCDNDGVLDVGEGGLITIKLQNTGWATLAGATLTVTTTNPNVQYPSGNSLMVPSTPMLGAQTLTMPVSLGAGITNPSYLPFTITINAPNSCAATVTGAGEAEVNYDVTVPNTAAGVTNEQWEGSKTVWTPKLTSGAPTTNWSIVHPSVPTPVGLNEVAWGQDLSGVSDHTLESPDLVVGNAGFSVTFQHRYDFERSGGTNWDGGVIEISQDNGMTWADVTTFAGVNAGYIGAITNQAGNPLAGRQAYVGVSNNFATGNMLTRTLNFNNTFNNKTIRMRFRIGTDEAAGAGGWFIDNVNFTGLTNKPFSTQVNHNCAASTCGNGMINSGEACDDGNKVNGDCCSSTCQFESAATVCRAAANACDVAETCTGMSATCPMDTKAANGTACSDGNGCTQMDTCNNGTCVAGMPVTCVAMDACHTAGTCDPMTGMCSNPNAPNGTACNDNNACTQMDSCNNGSCTGANPITCMASDQCHTAGVCDPMTGMCSNPNAPNGTACNDNNACTQMDSCSNGSCTGANPVICMASDQCHTAGTCNPMTGMCSNPNAADGTTCNDGNACTLMDSCANGTCAGTPVTCPANECQEAGTCDQATGMCNNAPKPNGTPCTDGTCQAGVCTTASGAGGSGGTGGTAGAGGVGGTAGTGGVGGTAGMGGSGGTAEGGAGGTGGSRPPVLSEGGCGCAIPGEDPQTSDMAGSLLALVGAWFIRRRRNRKSA